MNRKEIILEEIEKDPNNPINLYFLAIEERAEGNLDACILVLKRIINIFPAYQPTYYTLAELLYEMEQSVEANGIVHLGILKAREHNLPKVVRELESLIMLND